LSVSTRNKKCTKRYFHFVIRKCEKYELIEAASKFINGEYSLLNEKSIDIIVKALPNNIQETLEL